MENSELVPILKQVLDRLEIENTLQGEELTLPDGLLLKPRLLNQHTHEKGGFQTATIVEARHPRLFENGVFEYQYAFGDTLEESLASGFGFWADLDLVTLRDATLAVPEHCTVMEINCHADEAHVRQILFGPTGQYRRDEPDAAEAEAHPFCPCCLFTNSMEAFSDLLKSDAFLGVRLFAARDANGDCSADCRINGQDFTEAMPLLREYAKGWPQAGYEFRKQYVVIRNKPQIN